MARRGFSNVATPLTITGSLNNTDTTSTFSVSTTPSGWPSTFPYYAAIDLGTVSEEVVSVTAQVGTSFTVTRASSLATPYGSTTKSHSASATLKHVASAIEFDEMNAHVNATTNVHGTSGALIDAATAQTLANKTLTSPVINTPTINTPTFGSPLTQAQTHASPDTDAAAGSLHHTIGAGATQAAAGNHTHAATGVDPHAILVSIYDAGNVLGATWSSSSGGTAPNYSADLVTNGVQNGQITSSTTGFGTFSKTLKSTTAGAVIPLSGTVRITARVLLLASAAAGSSFQIGICDGSLPSPLNGGVFIFGSDLSMSAVKRSGGTPTTTALTAASASTYYDISVAYPIAGGTATFYVNGTAVTTHTSCPALTSGVFVSHCLKGGGSGTSNFYLAQIAVTG